MFIFIVNFDVKTNEKLPTQLCSECETILCKADAFKRRCIESETFLRDHVNIDDLTQIDVDIFTKTEVEDEIPVKKSKNNKGGVKKRSPKSEKSKKSKDLQLMDESTCKDEKDGIADILADNFDGKISDILDLKQTDMEVKTESFNDDIDMDFMDSDIDTPLISLKQENLSLEEVQLFSCSCGVHFNKEIEYKSHLDEKKCEGYTKSTKIKLEKLNPNGGRNISVKRSIVCPECNLEFKTVKACKVHRRIHKNGDETGRFECNKCMRKFNRKSSYTTHINHHEVKANLKFTCDTCKREFQHRAHLDNHILALHTRDKGYICEVCSNSFSTQESLETHKESHKMEKKHQCNLCKKAFYMLSTLNDHMRTHTGEKPFLCSVCGKGFSQKTNLAQHVRRHQGLKPFKCEDCDKKFVSKGELVAHNRKHSGAHPFICDECGAGFTTSSSLVKHRRIHTGERPYACDLCPMRFAASGTLKNHRRTHTGEKPFQCSYCEKAFVQRHDLISHIRCHTGERPFACECGLAFRKVASLRHHAKTHARDPPHALLDERMKMGID